MSFPNKYRTSLVTLALTALTSASFVAAAPTSPEVKPTNDAQKSSDSAQLEIPRSKPCKLFLLGGQSNMDGCGRGEDLPKPYQSPPANVVTWDNRKQCWVPLTKDSMAIARHQQFGPEMAFAHRLAKAYPGQTIAITKTSAGGTKLHTQWVPGKVMYRRFIQNFRNATKQLEGAGVDYEIGGMLWMQGESDSETIEMANAYEENLKRLVADVRKQTNHDTLPIVMGRISSSLLEKTPWNFDHARIVQAAQEAIAAEDGHVYIINTDELSTLKDNTHFDTEAQLTLGGQMGDIMLRALLTPEDSDSHIKDFGLKPYTYLSKDLPHREAATWKLVCQLPHNAQFQPWIEIDSPEAGKEITLHTTNPLANRTQEEQKYTTVAGVQTYEVPGWIPGEGALYTIPAGVTVRAVKYRETGYDTGFAGSFVCNDDDYNVLWKKARRTCYLCMRDHFMDCPDRERTPKCLGDVCLQIEQIFYTFDRKSHELAKRAILDNPDYTHIIGQNLMFAGENSTWFYYLNTGDLATISLQYPNLKRYLAKWEIGENGLPVHNTNGWDWCDWGSPSKDRHVVQCCQYYSTLKACRKMALATGNAQDVPAFDRKLKSIENHFDGVFWKGGFYQSSDVDYPDERANAMAVVTGLADESRWKPIFENVLSRKLCPDWEVGNTYNASSYFERWIMEALCIMGEEEFALLRMHDRYKDQIEVRTTSLWEHFGRWWQTKFDPNSSQNHGWNSPNTILSRYIAGIAPETAAWGTYHVLPKEAFLTEMKTVVPTIKGDVTVRVHKTATQYSLNLDSPDGTLAIVGIPKRAFSKLDSIAVNGTNIWDGTYRSGVEGITWNGEDKDYIKFNADPGTWAFAGGGSLPSSTVKSARVAPPVATLLDKKGWKATASITNTGPKMSYWFNPINEGSADDAIDGDAWTCWNTGIPQAGGQWFIVDMQKPQTFDKIVLVSSWAPYDFPRGYRVLVSDDGQDWGSPIASGTGTESLTKINFQPQTKRFIKLQQTDSDDYYWWSIFELDVYRK